MRLIFSILLLCNYSFALDIKLVSKTSEKVYRGDIVKFSVDTSLDIEKLKKYENKRVDDLLYIISISEESNEIIAEAIIAEKGLKEKLDEPEDKFSVYNLDFIPTKKSSIKEFILMDSGSLSKENRLKYYIITLVIFILFILPLILKKLRKRKEIKLKEKEWNKNQNSLLEELRETRNRNDIECICQKKQLIEEYFEFDKEKLNSFIDYIDKIQYKKDWTGEELTLSLEKYRAFYTSVGAKNGI